VGSFERCAVAIHLKPLNSIYQMTGLLSLVQLALLLVGPLLSRRLVRNGQHSSYLLQMLQRLIEILGSPHSIRTAQSHCSEP
jgi:hypothetical protein